MCRATHMAYDIGSHSRLTARRSRVGYTATAINVQQAPAVGRKHCTTVHQYNVYASFSFPHGCTYWFSVDAVHAQLIQVGGK